MLAYWLALLRLVEDDRQWQEQIASCQSPARPTPSRADACGPERGTLRIYPRDARRLAQYPLHRSRAISRSSSRSLSAQGSEDDLDATSEIGHSSYVVPLGTPASTLLISDLELVREQSLITYCVGGRCLINVQFSSYYIACSFPLSTVYGSASRRLKCR